jgi:hypothetical protein
LFGAHKPARYDAKRAAVFAENLVEHVLLPYEQRHVTFTVPKRVRPYFKFDRTLNSILYDAAWESWKELILEQGPEPIIQYSSSKQGTTETRTFSPLEFLAELQQHIPDTWEQTSRWLGERTAHAPGELLQSPLAPLAPAACQQQSHCRNRN